MRSTQAYPTWNHELWSYVIKEPSWRKWLIFSILSYVMPVQIFHGHDHSCLFSIYLLCSFFDCFLHEKNSYLEDSFQLCKAENILVVSSVYCLISHPGMKGITIMGHLRLRPWSFINLKKQHFSPERPSIHTKTAFSVTDNETLWKRSPKWIYLKTPARRVSVDGENETFWKRFRDNSHITSVAISSKTLMWTENILSVFATKTPFSNLSSLVHVKMESLFGEKVGFQI